MSIIRDGEFRREKSGEGINVFGLECFINFKIFQWTIPFLNAGSEVWSEHTDLKTSAYWQ